MYSVTPGGQTPVSGKKSHHLIYLNPMRATPQGLIRIHLFQQGETLHGNFNCSQVPFRHRR